MKEKENILFSNFILHAFKKFKFNFPLKGIPSRFGPAI